MNEQEIHVLLVEDNPGDARLVREMGRSSPEMTIHHADCLAAAIAHISCQRVDVVLLDLGLPDSGGLATLQAVRQADAFVPVVVLTGHDDELLGRSAIREGAQDYLVKGQVDEHSLSRVVRYALERKQVEKAIRESEERFRKIYEGSPVGYQSLDPEGRILDVNPSWLALLGYQRQEVIGRQFGEFLTPASRADLSERFPRFLECGVTQASEFQVRRKDGEVRSIAFDGVFVRDGKGEPVFSHCVLHDVTEHRRAEEAIRKSEEYQRAIIDCSPLPIFSIDLDGNVLTWNASAEKTFGWEAHEVVGKPLPIIPADKKEEFDALRRRAVAGKQVSGLEFIRQRKNGELLNVSLWAAPVRDAGGRITAIVAFMEDITPRKKAEQEREKLQSQLIQAQKLEAIGRLTGGVAHDFNNILTVIIGNADLARAEAGRESLLDELLGEIKEAGERGSGLVQQLLAFSRKQVLQPEVVNINEVVAEMDRMLRRILGEDVRLETVLAPDLGRVEADVGQMEQVLMNLAVNARDAMPGGGKLTIETANVELDQEYARGHVSVTPGPHVMVGVSDTGEGMSPEVLAHVFEPFFTTKEKGRGTGLGLATVYGIVKQSGGNIWVYSERGQGTAFKIYLPRVDRAPAGAKERDAGSEVRGGSETLLVVEDEEMVRNLAVRVLKGVGYTVLGAQDGLEALAIVREHDAPIHLMVTDVVMPGMSGPQLASQLLTFRPGMRVLYVSGYTDNAIVHHGVLDAGLHFLQKPFTPDGLLRKVRETLDGGEGKGVGPDSGRLSGGSEDQTGGGER
jgi:PAS domain S-box-containing protein